MTPHAIIEGDLPALASKILKLADRIMEQLPPGATCHDAVDAWMKRTGMGNRKRGRYMGVFEHSWVDLGAGAILDLYPVGGVRPLMVTAKAFWLVPNPYQEKP